MGEDLANYIQNSFTCETSSQGSKKRCVVQRALRERSSLSEGEGKRNLHLCNPSPPYTLLPRGRGNGQLALLCATLDFYRCLLADLQSLDGVGVIVDVLNLAPGQFDDHIAGLQTG